MTIDPPTKSTARNEEVSKRTVDEAGAGSGLDENLALALDFDLWARFYEHSELVTTTVPLGGFRRQPNQRSLLQVTEYRAECEHVLARYRGQTLQNGWGLRAAQTYFALTGRGARKYGSRLAWVTYDEEQARWVFRTRLAI